MFIVDVFLLSTTFYKNIKVNTVSVICHESRATLRLEYTRPNVRHHADCIFHLQAQASFIREVFICVVAEQIRFPSSLAKYIGKETGLYSMLSLEVYN